MRQGIVILAALLLSGCLADERPHTDASPIVEGQGTEGEGEGTTPDPRYTPVEACLELVDICFPAHRCTGAERDVAHMRAGFVERCTPNFWWVEWVTHSAAQNCLDAWGEVGFGCQAAEEPEACSSAARMAGERRSGQ